MTEQQPLEPVRCSVEVAVDVEEAFRIFIDDIDSWWPLSTHSVRTDRAAGCTFEGKLGGRVFETDDDGRTHLWGMVTAWEPPHRVVFSWFPGRDESTAQEVELLFTAGDGGTSVELEHRRWETLGSRAEVARQGYESGWPVVLALYVERCGRPAG
jgi:uncharacterized protein YndB with AHSA1/START domain